MTQHNYSALDGVCQPTYKVQFTLWFIFPVQQDQVHWQSCRDDMGYDDLPIKSSIDFGLFSQYTKIRYTGCPVAMWWGRSMLTYL